MIENNEIIRELFLPDIEKCYDMVRKIRWKNGIVCLTVGVKRFQNMDTVQKSLRDTNVKICEKLFNDLTNTIFDHHKFPINEMFYILGNIPYKSTMEISEELGRDYKSVLNFVHEVQELSVDLLQS